MNVAGLGSVEGVSIVDGAVPQQGRLEAVSTAAGSIARLPRKARDSQRASLGGSREGAGRGDERRQRLKSVCGEGSKSSEAVRATRVSTASRGTLLTSVSMCFGGRERWVVLRGRARRGQPRRVDSPKGERSAGLATSGRCVSASSTEAGEG